MIAQSPAAGSSVWRDMIQLEILVPKLIQTAIVIAVASIAYRAGVKASKSQGVPRRANARGARWR